MNYKIVIFPLFLVTCLINQASPNCQQQPTVKHGHSSSSNVFSFNNLFNQQESSNNQQTWNQNLLFNPFELTFKAPGQTSQSHLGDNSNGLLVNPKVNNLASTSASSSSSGASSSSSKVNGGQTHATNRQLFAPGLFDFFQEQPTKVNVNSHGQTVNKGTSVAPKQSSQGKQLSTPLETLKSSSESTSSSSTESTSFSEFPLLFSGLVSATDAQDDADDLLGLIQQHQSQWGQNLPTQLTGPKQGTKVPKVNSGASSLSSSSSFNSASSFPGSSLSLGHSPQQKLPKDDTIKARQQLQNSGKFLQDSISSSVASSPFSFDQLLTGEGPKNGQGVEKDSLTSIFSDDSSSSDSASATSNVKSINQINQLQSTADLIKSLQQKQSHQQQNIEKIESQSPYEQLLSSSGLTPQLLQSLSSSVSLSSSSSSSVPKVNNLGHISKSHEKHPAVDLNSFFQQESDNQNRNSIVDRGNKGALNIPAQVEQKTNEQTKPVKSSVTIPLLTFPSTSKHSSGRPERSGSASIHSQNSKSGQTGTSARINNHGSVTKPVTNTEHDTLFSSFSSSFTPIFNSAFQIQSNEQQNLADLATIIQRQQNQKLTDQQKSNKDQSQKSSQTSIPSSSSSSSTDSSSLSTEQIQKLNTFDLLKLIQQENNEEKTNSNEDLATKIGQNSDKSKHQPPINTNKPTSSSPSSLSASTSVVSTSPSTSKLSTSQTVLPLSSINAKLQSDSLINSAALSLAALSSSNLGSPITTANSPLINGKTNVPLSATESESSSDSSSTSGSSLISALNKLSQTPILPSSKSLSSSTSSQDSVISNQQIINQNLPVKNEKSTDHRQIQTDQNKQYNKQKTPSIIDSQPSLQLHSKSDLKTPIQSLPIEQVTENIKNQQKSSSTLPTTTSSLTALTDLSSLSTDQIQQLTKADFIGLLQNQNNKEKPTSHESLVPNIRQNSGKPTVSSDTESSSVSSSNSAFLTLPSTTKLSKQMSSSSAESSGTHLPLSVTASEAAIAAALSSLSDLNDDDDDDDDDDDETEDEESTEESSEIVKQSVRPVQTPIQPSSPTDLSSLSTARIQKINTEDLLKLTHPQNRKDKTTSEESSAPIIGQNSDKSKNRPTANTKPSPSSSSSAHSTSPSTLNSESNNNKQKLSAAQIYSEAGSMLTASSSLSDEQIKSLTASPSPKAKSSSLVSLANLDSLTTPPNTKLSKQLPTGTDVSSGENLPLVATNAAIGAGSAIATASALSSSDSDSSSVLLPLLHSSSLGYLSLQNDNQDSTDLKSGSIVTPLKKPTQTLITPAALSSSSLSTDLSSLTAEQIQQLTPEDLVKLLKQPNNQLDKTLSGVIPQNADQISGKDTKPLAVSSGRSSSSPSHSVLPASSTSPSTPSLHVQPAASIQPELTDSLTTSALASASVLSWLSAEQINQLTEAELMARIQQQQNNQRANISQKSSSSNGEKINDKGKNQEIKSMQAQANSALSVKPTPTTQPASEHSASSRVSTGQIHPTSSFNVNRILQNQNNGLTNQQAAIVGSLSKPSQTPILPSSLSKSTSSQDSIISNQQIINQNLNLPVKNKESVDRRQPNSEKLTQTEQNKQRNEQKTPSSMESHPSLQSHFKVDLKTPIKSPPSATEQVTEKSNNQQKLSTSASPTTPSSSLTSSTPLVSTATESSSDSSSPSVSSLITAIPISDQKSKAPTNKQTGIQPTTSSSSPSTAPSKTSPSPSIGFKSIPESSANSDDHSQHQNKGPPSQIAPINGLSVKPLISNPSSTTSSLTSLTDLSSLSTGQIQQLTKADLITLLQNQNNKEKPTSQESSAPIIEQSSDRSKNRPTAPSSSSSTHSTSPPTSNSESNNNKHKSSAAQINSEAGSMLTASSWLSDEQIKSLTASPSTNAKSSSLASSAILDSLTTQPNTKLPKQTTISSGASLEADLPLSATAIAAAAGTAITTGTALASASALSSSDADSDSSDASTLLQSFSLDGLGSLLDDEDSTDQKSDAVRSPKKVVQTLSALPTPALSSSSSSSTDLSSSSTGQTLSTELLKVMQQQKNKEKGASQEIIAPKTAQISNNQPSLSVGSSVSKSKPDDNRQMPSIIDMSLETYSPLSATAIAAGLSSTDSDSLPLLSGASQHRNKVTTDEKPGNVHQPPSKKPSPTSTASSSSPSTFISSSTTGLSSLSAEQIQKLPSEDLNKLLKQQNDQLDETVEESESQNNDQISSKNKKPTFSTGAAQTSSVSPSNPALTSKLSKQIPTGTDVSSGENLPLTATDLAIGAGNAIATASALSSSDSDSSSVLLPHLQTSSLGDLSLQNDNKDSTDLKSGSIVTPLNKPPQTLIVPSALSSSSLSTDLSSLTAEQIQQLTPEDLIKLLKKPNNQLDKTLKGIITENADQISGKNTKPLTIGSGTSPSSSSHSALPSSPTLPSTPSLHVQPAASIQSELANSLSTSA
ncbi:uncharacterized protein LOC107367422, partial [Tetranychus urticae]|uniref:uncharacterized protein LOC107367422 n=1 Tax=Tetranychus urticae TaxID=32264 RepID=UPI00077BFCF1